jgi:hypothetical protein
VKKIECYYAPASQKTFLDLEMESDFYEHGREHGHLA